jgi:hypothetical protein
MEDVDCNLALTTRSPQDVQKWEFIYVSDGYYNIRNIATGMYLTAPSNDTVGSLIAGCELDELKTDRQLWKFTETYDIIGSDNLQGKLQAKSQESSSLVMTANDVYSASFGYGVIQDVFIDDALPSDEWILVPVKKANLISIESFESNYDWRIAFNNSEVLFDNNYYLADHIQGYYTSENTQCLTARTIKNYMEDSNVFAIYAHGLSTENGTKMSLGSDVDEVIYSWDIYNFNAQTGIDMSGCELAVFVGCLTANHPTQSLPHAAVAAGAECALGFTEKIYHYPANDWTENFFSLYLSGEDVELAAEEAVYELIGIYDDQFIDSLYSYEIIYQN